jgi:hypothetical protein
LALSDCIITDFDGLSSTKRQNQLKRFIISKLLNKKFLRMFILHKQSPKDKSVILCTDIFRKTAQKAVKLLRTACTHERSKSLNTLKKAQYAQTGIISS